MTHKGGLWYTYFLMRKRILTFLAMLILVHVGTGDVVRTRVVPAEMCGAASVAPGACLVLPTFDGDEISLTLGERKPSVTGYTSYGAKSEEALGLNATVVEMADGFVATVSDPRTGHVFVFRRNVDGLEVKKIVPTRGSCGPCTKECSCAGPAVSGGGIKLAKVTAKPLTGNPLVDGAGMLKGEKLTNVVDVLIAFDKSGANWVRRNTAFGDISAFAQDRVQNMNNALVNSGLGRLFEFRLAGVIEVASDASKVVDKWGYVDIDRLVDYVTGYRKDANATRLADWKKIRSKRNAVGADLVSLLVDGENAGMIGLGFSLDNHSIRQKTFPDYAYNVCSVSVAAYGHTITHECGHNMGAGHAKMYGFEANNSGPQLYGYSLGHYFDVTNAQGVVIDHCATIMAYNDDGRTALHKQEWNEYANLNYVNVGGVRTLLRDSQYFADGHYYSGLYREVPFFSSPAVEYIYNDPATGRRVASGVPTGTAQHDNAKILSLTYPLVANYRLHREALTLVKSGEGAVSGGGLYEYGKKVALKATPLTVTDKKTKKKTVKSVFCGWYTDEAMSEPMPGAWQAASYTYVMPEDAETVYAKFLAPTDEAAKAIRVYTDADFYPLTPGVTASISLNIAAGCLPTAKAANLPKGLALKQRSDKSWYITGKPTTPGEKKVTITVTSAANKTGVKHTFRILVTNWRDDAFFVKDGALIADIYEDFVAGIPVTDCVIAAAANATATIPTALGLKFNGKTCRVTGTPKAPGKYLVTFTRKVQAGVDKKTKKPIYVTHKATALFVVYQGYGDHSKDRGVITPGIVVTAAFPSADGVPRPQEAHEMQTISVGVQQKIEVTAVGMNGVANVFSAKNLPPGLTINKNTGAITGTPTKAGTYAVTVSVSNKWKWTGSTSFTLNVEALPAWAKGTFIGTVKCRIGGSADGAWSTEKVGVASVSVGATGKISGKLRLSAANTATFSFNSYTEHYGNTFGAKKRVKVTQNRKTCMFDLELFVSGSGDMTSTTDMSNDAAGTANLMLFGVSGSPASKFSWDFADSYHLVQTRWTGVDKALAAALKGKSATVFTVEPGRKSYLYKFTLTFGANGTATVKCRMQDMNPKRTKTYGKWLPTTYSTSGTAVVQRMDTTGGSCMLLLPILVPKPADEYVEIMLFVGPDGGIQRSSATVP